MRRAKDRRITSSSFLMTIVAAALVLPACGNKKKGDDTSAGSSSPKGGDGAGGTTKAPPNPGPAPTDPSPTADPAPAPPPAEYLKLKVGFADPAKGALDVTLGKWSVVSSSFDPDFDPTNLERAKAKLEIDFADVSSGNKFYDDSIRSSNYLDVAKFPTGTVSVDNVKKAGDARYTADALVYVHGVEKTMNITMDVVASAADRVTVKVSQPLSRLDFKVGTIATLDMFAQEIVVEAVVTLKKP